MFLRQSAKKKAVYAKKRRKVSIFEVSLTFIISSLNILRNRTITKAITTIRSGNATIGEAISEIYHFMNYEYRNEYYYKNTILNQLLIKKHDLYNTAALTELPIGDSKADFIMINGRGVVSQK